MSCCYVGSRVLTVNLAKKGKYAWFNLKSGSLPLSQANLSILSFSLGITAFSSMNLCNGLFSNLRYFQKCSSITLPYFLS